MSVEWLQRSPAEEIFLPFDRRLPASFRDLAAMPEMKKAPGSGAFGWGLRCELNAVLVDFRQLSLDLFLGLAVLLLQNADTFLVFSLHFLDVVIGQVRPFLSQFAFELVPVAFNLFSIHIFLLFECFTGLRALVGTASLTGTVECV